MTQRFDQILDECIRRLEESGEDVETVLGRYPEHADGLRPHLEVWASLASVEKAHASSAGTMRARRQLLSAITRARQPEQRAGFINALAFKGGLGMKFVNVKLAAVFVAGIALALGAMFITGSFRSDGGPAAVAHSDDCINSLDFNDDGDLTVEDVDQLGNAIDDDDDADDDGISNDIDTDDDGDGVDDAVDNSDDSDDDGISDDADDDDDGDGISDDVDDDDDGDGVDDDVDDNEFDDDGDGDVDINDVVGTVGEFVTCLQDDQPPAP